MFARACGSLRFDEELVPDSPEHPLDLASSGGLARLAVGHPDPQHRQRSQQLAADHSGAVIEVKGLRNAA